MLKCYPDDLIIEIDAGHNHYLRPTRCGRHFGALVINTCKILRGYTIHKGFIKGDCTEEAPFPVFNEPLKTRQQAASIITMNIFNEIGWQMSDIEGKFCTVFHEVEQTGPCNKYSFANCEWWIEEVY